MNNQFNLIDVVRTILKHKMLILGVAVLSGIFAVIFSLFVMDEYYKSHSIIYPINQGITDRSALFAEKGSEQRVDYYGTKNDVNRILQLAESSQITDFLINYYHLAEHYKIDTTSKYWRYKTKKKFNKNYQVIKTEQEAVEISMLDTDPALAAEMVNMVVEKIDEHNKAPVVKNKLRIASTFQKSLEEKTAVLDSTTKALNALGEQYSIKVFTDADGKSVVNGPSATGVSLYKVALNNQQTLLEEVADLQRIYEQFALSASENVPSVYVVEEAYASDHKEKPIRWLFCASVVLISVFCTILAILAWEQIKQIKAQL